MPWSKKFSSSINYDICHNFIKKIKDIGEKIKFLYYFSAGLKSTKNEGYKAYYSLR